MGRFQESFDVVSLWPKLTKHKFVKKHAGVFRSCKLRKYR